MSDSFKVHDSLFTIVKNTSGADRVFSFLPPHGVKLLSDEEYSIFGAIAEGLHRGGSRTSARRNQQALVSALDSGDLSIMQTPATILTDATSGAAKALHLNNGTLSVVDPSWEQATSESLDVIGA